MENLPVERAAELASSDPDFAIRDLYNAIANGNFPSWTFYIQVMTMKEAESFRWNPFDVTKVSSGLSPFKLGSTIRERASF